MTDDNSDDAAEYRCLVPFTDPSESFVHGFEAGMVWQRMVSGETVIKSDVAFHCSNAEVFRRMAAAQGYDLEQSDIGDGWMNATFTKRRNRLSLVP